MEELQSCKECWDLQENGDSCPRCGRKLLLSETPCTTYVLGRIEAVPSSFSDREYKLGGRYYTKSFLTKKEWEELFPNK